jgi:hypothetical protein
VLEPTTAVIRTMLSSLILWASLQGASATKDDKGKGWELLVSVASTRMCQEYGKDSLLGATLYNSSNKLLTAYEPYMYGSLWLVSVDGKLPDAEWRVRPAYAHTEFVEVPPRGALVGVIDPSRLFNLRATKPGSYRVRMLYRDSAANDNSEIHSWGKRSQVGELLSPEFELVVDKSKRIVAVRLGMKIEAK